VNLELCRKLCLFLRAVAASENAANIPQKKIGQILILRLERMSATRT
jgi:hypothetical protein